MKKDDLLRSIAEKGYDVGFGAKKHLATYDIVDKVPGFIGFASLAFGIFALVVKGLSTELTSATFIVLGIMGLYINFYDEKKLSYEQAGIKLTKLYNELKALYFKTKSSDDNSDFTALQAELSEIESRYYPECISKQILFSNWYAHYKFFWEHQIDWVNEQLVFRFFRDKIPLSLWFTIVLALLGIIVFFSDLLSLACDFLEK